MQTTKIAVVEQNEEFRSAITKLIHVQPDLEVIFQAEDDKQLLNELKIISPHIVLMDVNDADIANQIKENYPSLKVIPFSEYFSNHFFSN